jgi:putative hydrolase of HD superfamily
MDFYLAIQGLKRTKRQGWINHKIPNPESVADHMYRMSLIAMTLGDDRLIKMCLVHDLAECIIGDITPMDNVPDKDEQELAAMKQLVAHLNCGNEIIELFLEYQSGQTDTAMLCKDIDKFEMILQAFEYEQGSLANADGHSLSDFFESTRGKFKTPKVQALVQQLYALRQ